MEVRGKEPCWLVLSKWLVSLYVGPVCDHVLGTLGSLRLARCGMGKPCKQVSQTRLWASPRSTEMYPETGLN